MMSTNNPSEAAPTPAPASTPAPHASMVEVEIEGGGLGNLFGGTSAGTGVPSTPHHTPLVHTSADTTDSPGHHMPTGIAQSKPQPRPLTPEKKQIGLTEKTLPGPDSQTILSEKDSIPEPTSPVHHINPHNPLSKQTEPQPPVSATTF